MWGRKKICNKFHTAVFSGRPLRLFFAMPLDWDDVFAYTTAKRVTVRHRWLGMTYYTILLGVLAYIIYGQIYLGQSNMSVDVHGAITGNVEGVGSAALRPLDDRVLETLRPTSHVRCIYSSYWCASEVGVDVESSLMVATVSAQEKQHHNAAAQTLTAAQIGCQNLARASMTPLSRRNS